MLIFDVSSLIIEYRKFAFTIWILDLNFFEFDTLLTTRSERMRT